MKGWILESCIVKTPCFFRVMFNELGDRRHDMWKKLYIEGEWLRVELSF
jgi:hypothetical protein